MSNKIIFHANSLRCGRAIHNPKKAVACLPDWYKKAEKYSEYSDLDGSIKKSSTYKNCVPFFDAMSSGYVFQTLCDIKIEEKDGKPILLYNAREFPDWIESRSGMPGFAHPDHYYEDHFAWLHPWSVETPKGFSALFTHPLNRIDLPFFTFSGIIDSDGVNMTGRMPFLIKKGFSGVIPAGTPFVQIIPIQRAEWESEIKKYGLEELMSRMTFHHTKYSNKNRPDVYRRFDWKRKKYH